METQNEQNAEQPKQNAEQPKQPKTIEELKQWYERRHLPPEEVTRFFIGKNITQPKAFGIYKNKQGECVVYKNKANGQRAIRYQGKDEAFAVGEILQRLKDEIVSQKARKATDNPLLASGQTNAGCTKTMGLVVAFFGLIFAGIVGLTFHFCGDGIPNGYYNYQGHHYYHQGTVWFLYNTLNNDWYETQSLDNIINRKNADQYRTDKFEGKRFEETQWYYNSSDDSDYDDDDDDYDWGDDDSWDSDDTDWDSDW